MRQTVALCCCGISGPKRLPAYRRTSNSDRQVHIPRQELFRVHDLATKGTKSRRVLDGLAHAGALGFGLGAADLIQLLRQPERRVEQAADMRGFLNMKPSIA